MRSSFFFLFVMPPLNSRATRELVKRRNIIPGPRSLHRGIHFHENERTVQTYKQNGAARRSDHRDLLVHHQKINEELQDVYARTAALHAADATMEQRVEESWRRFERIGGRRPAGSTSASPRGDGDHLRNNRTGVAFAERLSEASRAKKELRERAEWERKTRGEAVDYSKGSALHAAKDKRIALFQRRQLKREHLLRRMGDPTPLKQSGKYDIHSGTLRVFNKTIRKVQREVQHDERVQNVKRHRKNSRSMWDVWGGDENPNRPSQDVVRYTREFQLGPRRKNAHNKRKRAKRGR